MNPADPYAPPATGASPSSRSLRVVRATSRFTWLAFAYLFWVFIPVSFFRPHGSGQEFRLDRDPVAWLLPSAWLLMLAFRLFKESRDTNLVRSHPFAVERQPQAGGSVTLRSFSHARQPGYLFLTRDSLAFCATQGRRMDAIVMEPPWEIPLSAIASMETSGLLGSRVLSFEAVLRLHLRSGETVRITTRRAGLWSRLIEDARAASPA